MKPKIEGICDDDHCHEPEITQGMCIKHLITCPKCGLHPCNPNVDDPECDDCIMSYKPDDWDDTETDRD